MFLEASSCRSFLSEELVRRLRANPRYSQRAFARQLGLSPGELSEILRGKRSLSFKSAFRIAKALSLSPLEIKHLVHLIQDEKSKKLGEAELLNSVSKELSGHQLTMDMFHVVSDWYCFAILNLVDCYDFRSNLAWIARRLGISRAEVQLALDRLKRLGLLKCRGAKWTVTQDYVISPAGFPSEAIRNYHRQILKKAMEALDLQQVSEREISGVGFALDPKVIPLIKKEISEFQDRIITVYSANSTRKGKKTEVYQLESVFFKLTQNELKGDGS